MPGRPSNDPIPAWIPPIALGLLFAGLAAWSWDKWADPMVDFGSDPYVAWQILQGRAVYSDVAYLYGPISPWVNALWFSFFGPSLATLAWCNLAIAACLAVVVYRFCTACADRLAATAATVVLLVSFVFAYHTEDAANYNFVWPYSHAATHGTLILVCGVVMLSRAVLQDRVSAWGAAGVLLGTTALIKPEIATAGAVVACVGVVFRVMAGPPYRLRGPGILLIASTAPAALCGIALGRDALLAPWLASIRVASGQHVIFTHWMGTDDVPGNLWRLGVAAGLLSLAVLGLIAADVYGATRSDAQRRRLVIAAVAVIGALLAYDLPGVGRPLPVLIPTAAIALVWIVRRRPAERSRLIPLVLWACAAWVLLGRMLLNVHLHHYGFYLAMPAAVLVAVLGIGVVPRLLAEWRPGGGRVVRPVALAIVGLLLAYSIGLSATHYAHMTVPVGRSQDAMFGPNDDVSSTGSLAAALTQHIDALVRPDATLAVVPQGTLLNFLMRRPNPTPYQDLAPITFTIHGKDRVLAAYEAQPPDYVALVDWSDEECGVGTFGSPQWGAEFTQWLARRYDRIESVPSSAVAAGFSLWKRRG